MADCKRNLKIEQVASKSTAYALVQTAMEGFPRANDIIRAIATFSDDQVGSLPEGFVLYE